MEQENQILDSNEVIGLPLELYPASLGKRFGNFIIDYIVNLVLGWVAGIVMALTLGYRGDSRLTNLGVAILLFIAYYFMFELFIGKTVGKMITRTHVVTEQGEKPTAGAIMKRTLLRLVPFEPFTFFGGEPLGMHDKVSRTVVIAD